MFNCVLVALLALLVCAEARLKKPTSSTGFYSIEKIMGDCDADGDGYLTERDFARNAKTCIATCSDVEKFFFFIVEPAKKMNYAPKRVVCE